uniref:sodium-coupled monocarboxylate transporter 2-like n=1 Tax=Styela clava TaxID=7725 RepID=UPI001939C433|nr:sodium-coupled monocarboxylate transporter 2-like [Styela clava]
MECSIGDVRSQTCYTFGTWDYVVFSSLFVISGGIGLYFAYTSRTNEEDKEDYLLAGRNLPAFPVSLSMTASFMSAIAVLGLPSEFYIFGTMFWWYALSFLLMAIVMSEVYIPIFYRLKITSTYEYLEIRFNRPVRLLATTVYIINSSLYVGVVIYAPSLALNAVTGLGIWWSVALTAGVCMFYTSLGGMKAVVWTDVFQCLVMWIGLVAVIARASVLLGGFNNMWQIASDGGRIQFENFDIDPRMRHTFWTISLGGTLYWIGTYGTTQTMAQRYISCKSENQARLAVHLNVIGLWIVLLLVGFAGLFMYAYYAGCDPYSKQWVGATDQLMPYFVLEILHDYPGLPGIFVCSAFSGTLSTVSSATNAMATVTLEDFITPFKKLSAKKTLILSKVLVVIYGLLCTIMAVLTSQLGTILEVAFSINSIVAGGMTGLFTLGMLLPWCNSYGAFSGLLSGLAMCIWVYVGSTIYPPTSEMLQILPLCTDNCNGTSSSCGISDIETTYAPYVETTIVTYNATTPTDVRPPIAELYSVSYLYYNIIGFLTTIIVGLVVSFATGYQEPSLLPPETIRPIFDHLLFRWLPKKVRRFLWCGVRHDREEEDQVVKDECDVDFTYKSLGDSTEAEIHIGKTISDNSFNITLPEKNSITTRL